MRRLALLLLLATCSRDDARHAPVERTGDRASSATPAADAAAQAAAQVSEVRTAFLGVEPRLWHRTGALAEADVTAIVRATQRLDGARELLAAVAHPPAATLGQLASASGDLARLTRPVDEGHGPDEYSYSIKTAKQHLDFALEYIEIWQRAGYH